ncbi:OmpA family protein [Tunicatimonas pelagia]|uniref:OmpA family protein n=1 Tax=Tunicatimonas pelagia TaxID=931531 RepID=UPI0026661B67|nr:OmpA family protein [Tunicatimonas pelagia]WKN43074.1 OmpA family protein [Tunicatimonas pelagia]
MKLGSVLLCAIGLLWGGEIAWAQSSLIRQGDKLYEQMAYIRALDFYQKAHKKDSLNQLVKLKIAESYRHLNDPANAETWYSQVINDSVAATEHKLYYAEALSSNGKYEQAQQWFESYAQERGQERRIQNRVQGVSQSEVFYRNQSFISVNEAAFNSPQSDFAPTFYDSGLVFTSARQGSGRFAWDGSNYLDLYQLQGERDIKSLSKTINSRYHEGSAVFFADNTKVVFTRSDFKDKKLGKSQDGVNKLKLFYAEKQESGKWSKPELLPFNSAEYSCGHPAIDLDTTLYFVSDMPGGFGGTDLYRSNYHNGQWQAPVNLGSTINTEGDEMFPFLRVVQAQPDKELYFASNGHQGLGGLDVFGINITQGTDGHITNLGYPINTSMDDFSLIVDTKNQTKRDQATSGYFASNREEGTGSDDIYHFTSLKPLLDQPMVKGVVMDEQSKTFIPGAKVVLRDAQQNEVASTVADDEGNYSFVVELDRQYEVVAQQSEYLENKTQFSTTEEKIAWEADVLLSKNHSFSLFGLIAENDTGEPIDGVQVILTDNMIGKPVLDITTDTRGTFSHSIENKELNDRISYQIQLSKEGYLSKMVTFNSQLTEPGQIDLHEVLDVRLDKIDIGTDIGALIDIQPIYFDLGKYVIRPDAAQELDKMVATMKENPGLEIELGSHTDARGSASSNLRLSDKRAKASADYIVSQGISRSRIVGKGYGESNLINRCADGVSCSEEEHQLNRRTEFKVTKF